MSPNLLQLALFLLKTSGLLITYETLSALRFFKCMQTSITAKNNEITSLQTARDAVRTPINEIKEARSEYQLQKYGYRKTEHELDADVASANLIVQTLQDPDLAQFIRE